MLGSLFIGKVFGIRISIHWTFLILIGYIVISSSRDGDTIWQALTLVGFTLCIFACITLHELGHSLMARRFGIQTRAITLLPIGGLASLERMPDKPGQELAVAIAGPLVNIVIGILIVGILFAVNLIPSWDPELAKNLLNLISSPGGFFFWLAIMNVGLAVFNMVPAFPMDGGRVFRATLSFWMKRVTATRVASVVGQILAGAYAAYSIFNGDWLGGLLGFFIFNGARSEYQQVKTESLMGGFTVRDILMTNYTIFHPYQRIQEAVQKMLSGTEKNFLVIKDQHFEGILTSKNIIAGMTTGGGDEMIGKVLIKNESGVLDINDSISKAVELFRKTSLPLMPVVENGKLAGVVDIENVNEFLNMQGALRK